MGWFSKLLKDQETKAAWAFWLTWFFILPVQRSFVELYITPRYNYLVFWTCFRPSALVWESQIVNELLNARINAVRKSDSGKNSKGKTKSKNSFIYFLVSFYHFTISAEERDGTSSETSSLPQSKTPGDCGRTWKISSLREVGRPSTRSASGTLRVFRPGRICEATAVSLAR